MLTELEANAPSLLSLLVCDDIPYLLLVYVAREMQDWLGSGRWTRRGEH